MLNHNPQHLAVHNLDSIRLSNPQLRPNTQPRSYSKGRTGAMFFVCNQSINQCRIIWTAVVGDLRHIGERRVRVVPQ